VCISRCVGKAECILKDATHALNDQLVLLPSRRCYLMPRAERIVYTYLDLPAVIGYLNQNTKVE